MTNNKQPLAWFPVKVTWRDSSDSNQSILLWLQSHVFGSNKAVMKKSIKDSLIHHNTLPSVFRDLKSLCPHSQPKKSSSSRNISMICLCVFFVISDAHFHMPHVPTIHMFSSSKKSMMEFSFLAPRSPRMGPCRPFPRDCFPIHCICSGCTKTLARLDGV